MIHFQLTFAEVQILENLIDRIDSDPSNWENWNEQIADLSLERQSPWIEAVS